MAHFPDLMYANFSLVWYVRHEISLCVLPLTNFCSWWKHTLSCGTLSETERKRQAVHIISTKSILLFAADILIDLSRFLVFTNIMQIFWISTIDFIFVVSFETIVFTNLDHTCIEFSVSIILSVKGKCYDFWFANFSNVLRPQINNEKYSWNAFGAKCEIWIACQMLEGEWMGSTSWCSLLSAMSTEPSPLESQKNMLNAAEGSMLPHSCHMLLASWIHLFDLAPIPQSLILYASSVCQ